jgi:polysaccharide export outer membrane protein
MTIILGILVPISAAAQDEADYTIGPDDVLKFQVWSRPDLSGEATVDPSGEVLLPLLGSVQAAGRTPVELGEELSERYRIMDTGISEVLVSVAEYRSRSVTVVGEVKSPGRFTFQEIPGIWEILLNAGGATSEADLAAVQVVRKDPKEGEPPTVSVDLSAGIEDTDPASLPKLRPRDTLIIPSLEGETPSGDNFQILGSVKTPGVYRIGTAETVIEALAVSGGSLPQADLRKVLLTRPTSDGVVSYHLDIQGHLSQGKPLADFELKAGDTVMVPGKKLLGVTSVFNLVLGVTSILTAVSTLIIALS